MLKRLGLFAGRCFQDGKALAEFENLQEHVAEEDAAYGGARRWRGGCRRLERGELLCSRLRPGCRLRCDATNGRLQSNRIAAFGCDAAELQERRQIARIGGENLLDNLLELRFAVTAALAFNFESKLVIGANVGW